MRHAFKKISAIAGTICTRDAEPGLRASARVVRRGRHAPRATTSSPTAGLPRERADEHFRTTAAHSRSSVCDYCNMLALQATSRVQEGVQVPGVGIIAAIYSDNVIGKIDLRRARRSSSPWTAARPTKWSAAKTFVDHELAVGELLTPTSACDGGTQRTRRRIVATTSCDRKLG